MKHQPNIFCHALPPDWDNSHEVALCISQEKRQELNKIPRGKDDILRGVVAYDSISRKYWAIRHFPCFNDSFECCCAAQAAPLDGPDAKFEWPAIEFPEEEECPHCGCSCQC